jgi:hypothetical protein
MRSLKIGAIKARPIANPKCNDLLNKLTSLIDSKTDVSKHLENDNVTSITKDIFETDFTLDEAKVLQSHLNAVLSVHGEDVDVQNKSFEDHTMIYYKELNLTELGEEEKDFIKYLRMMKMKGLVLEAKKLEFYLLAIRLLSFTAENANPQFRIDRLMSRVVNKIVVLSDEDGFDKLKYINAVKDADTKVQMDKEASILKKRDVSRENIMSEPVLEEDNDIKETQTRKLKAKSVVPKQQSFLENIFRSMSSKH